MSPKASWDGVKRPLVQINAQQLQLFIRIAHGVSIIFPVSQCSSPCPQGPLFPLHLIVVVICDISSQSMYVLVVETSQISLHIEELDVHGPDAIQQTKKLGKPVLQKSMSLGLSRLLFTNSSSPGGRSFLMLPVNMLCILMQTLSTF